jgi:CubicO group peptidase (beta-lactamase class C family)
MFVRAVTVVLVTAVVLSTAGGARAQTQVPSPPSEISAVVVPPGQIDRAVRAVGGIARGLLRTTGVPGMAIAIVHDDRVVFLQGFGVRRAGAPKLVDADTVFDLASLSKPVGAAVIAGAVGRGCVQWTDPVATYLPGFALSDPDVGNTVTIADMYAHRSGLADHAGDLLEDLGYDRGTILRRLALEPLNPFRITYNYTNFGLTAGAVAAASACGKPWEQLSHDILYAPLGMTATSSRFRDYIRAPNHADLHVRQGGAWRARFVRDADAQSPAGGVSSSAADMARFLRMELANGRFAGRPLIDERALLQTRNPNLATSRLASPISRAGFYGLGINVGYDAAGRLRLSHSGAFSLGASTTIVMLPSERLGIVVLTNAAPIGLPETLAAEFMDLAEFGSVRYDWYGAYSEGFKHLDDNRSRLAGKHPPASPIPARANDAYAGTYANAYYGPATVRSANGKLGFMLGPRHMTFTLAHWSGDAFSYFPRGENALGISAVTFSIGARDTRARTMTIENLDAEKLGTFVRGGP